MVKLRANAARLSTRHLPILLPLVHNIIIRTRGRRVGSGIMVTPISEKRTKEDEISVINKARERKPTQKAQGVTPSERYLNDLCQQSFLSLWSYPGIFSDKNKRGTGDGQEICDMLVVFDEHVLIFSDKSCQFPETGDLELDWKRWYRRAIKKSAGQARKAEKWLKEHPKRVFLDRACTKRFPLNIPPANSAKYHLILVANGSEERCKVQFGGSGSLMLNSSLGQLGNKDELSSTPFMVGDLDPNRTFVHILTESTLDILLQTLDTISDFVWYLEKKEKLFRSDMSVIVPGEEDLLAFYLMQINNSGEHDFVIKGNYDAFCLEEGFWEDFCIHPQRQAQIEHNKISYLWDDLIERFSVHALNATQYFTTHTKLSETEIGLRFMAREPRTVRRLLMENLIDFYINTKVSMSRIKWCKPASPGGAYYVFLAFPQPEYASSYEEYREARRSLLEICLRVAKHKFPEALDLVGIASEPVREGVGSSEDLMYLDARNWSNEMDTDAAKLQRFFGLFTSVTFHHAHVKEYPD